MLFRSVRHHRSHVDDASVAAAFHHRDKGAAEQENARHVCADHVVPFGERELGDRLAEIDARVAEHFVTSHGEQLIFFF